MIRYDKKEKRTLTMYVFVFLLVVLGIAIGGHFSYQQFEQEFRHQAENQISAIAELKVNELVNWRNQRLSDAGFLYRNPAFSALVERYFENPDDIEARAQLLSRLEYYQVYNQYDSVRLLDATGAERLSNTTPDLLDSHLAKDVIACLRLGEIVFLDFHHTTSADGEIHLTVLVPIFADNNNPLGVLALSINPQTYLYPYIQDWPIPSDTAETLLVRREGEDVLFLNELRFEKNAALNLRYPLTSTDIPSVKAVLGQTGIVEGVDYRGELVLADVRAVPDSPWFLVSKMDTTEVYAPLRERLWQTLLIIGMAILVAGTGLALVWRQQRILLYRSQAEVAEAVRDSEEKFRKAFVLSPDSININRLQDGMYVSINDGFTKITGYTPDEVIGKTSLETDIWADPQDRKKLVEGLTKNGEVENLEMRFRMKNGEVRTGLMSASVLELNGTLHIISITRDISERKQADEKMRQAQLVLENSPVVLFRWKATAGWPVELVSENVAQFGYSPEELLSGAVPYASIIHPDDLERVGREVSGYSANGVDHFQQEYRVVTRDGQVRWTDDQTMIERDARGNITHYQGTVMDITERRQAEDALRQSEENLSTTLHSIGDGVISTDKNGLITNMNPVAEKYCGWTFAEAKGQPLTKVFNIINAETRKRVENPVARVMESGQIAGLANHTVLISKNGREYQIADSAAPIKNKNGEITGVVLAFSDVTEKYKAEQILRESEESFADIFQTVSEGIAYTTLGGQVLSINKSLEKILEIPQEQIVGKNILSLAKDLLSAENIKKAVPVLVSLIQGREIQPFEVEYKTKILEITATINRASGRLTGVVRDTTERKQAEEAQRAAEARYRALVEQIPAITYIDQADGSGRSSFVSPQIQLMLDVSPEDWLQADAVEWGRMIHPEDSSRVLAAYRRTVETGQPFNEEYRIFRPDGRLVWVDDHAVRLDDASGQPSGIHGVMFDITERKQAEEELSRQTTLFRNLFERSPEAIAVVDHEDRVLEVNRSFENLFGYLKAEAQGHYINDLLAPEPYLEGAQENTQAILGNGLYLEKEVIRCSKDGRPVDVSWIGFPIVIDGRMAGGFAIYRDITERKQADAALRESEEKMSSIFRVAPTGIGVVRDRVLYEVNPRISEMTGYTKEELTGQSARILYPTQDEFEWVGREKYNQIAEKGSGVVETHWQKKDGSIVDILLSSTPIDLADLSKGVTFTALDITERKRAEEELGKQTALFRNLFEGSPEAIAILDPEDRVLEVNRSFETLFGYIESEARGRNINDLVAPGAYLDDARNVSQEVFGNSQIVEKESVRCTKDGRPIDVSLIGYPIVVNGHMSGAYAIYRDITERKRAEEALRAAEEKYRNIFESAMEAITQTTPEGKYITANPYTARMLGFDSPAEMIASVSDLDRQFYVKPGRREEFKKLMKEHGSISDFESEVYRKDGSRIWILENSRTVRDEHGNLLYYEGTAQDIAERKRAEDELKRNANFTNTLLDAIPTPVFYKDTDGRYLGCNQAFAEIMGVTSNEIQGKTVHDLWPSELAEVYHRKDVELMENPQHQSYEFKVSDKNGVIHPVIYAKDVFRDELGQVAGMVGAFIDITERKQAEEALKENEAIFSSFLEHSPVYVFFKDKDIRPLMLSKNYEQMLGMPISDLLGKTMDDLFPSDLAKNMVADDLQVLNEGRRVTVEEEFNGHVYETTKFPVLKDGKPYILAGFTLDITDRKQAEEALRASEERLRLAVLAGRMGTWERNFLSGQLNWSVECKAMFGLSPEVEMNDERFTQVLHPEDRAPTDMAIREALEKQTDFDTEYRVIWPDGTIHWIAAQGRGYYNEAGQAIHMAGITFDITERKLAEEALIASTEFSNSLIASIQDGISVLNTNSIHVMVNPALCSMTGYSREELANCGTPPYPYWPPEEYENIQAAFQKTLKNETSNFELIFMRKNGERFPVIVSPSAVKDGAGNIVYYMATVKDITNRKQAEDALRESESRFRTLFEQAAVGVAQLDTNTGRFSSINQKYCDILGYTQQEMLDLDFQTITHPDDLVTDLANMQKLIAGEISEFSMEKRYYRKDGSIVWVSLTVSPLWTEGELPNAHIAVVEDITARRQAEEALRESRALFRSLIESMPQNVFSKDLNGRFVFANQHYCATEGKTLAEIIGKTDFDLHPAHLAEQYWADDRHVIEVGQIVEKEEVHQPLGGEISYVQVAKAPIYDADGQAKGMLGIFWDITDRKRAEEALLESEERFRTLYDNATIGLYRTTPDGRILMLNPAGLRMLGFDSFDEVAGLNLEQDRYNLDFSRKEFRKKIESQGVVIGWENGWVRKDGSAIFVRESAKVFRDGNGQILYYDGSFEDVSARVQAEAALKESEELYRKMNQNSPLGMHFYKLGDDDQLIFTGANPAADKLLGVDNSQFIEKTIDEAFPPLMQTEVPQRYRDAAANGIPWSTEQIAYEDGQIRGAFEVKAFQTTPGNMVAVFADITARKKAEEALRESEALYRQAIEVANAVPYRQSYHVNGKTIYYDFMGEGIRQITGYGPEEFDEPLWDSLTQERFLLEELAEYSFDEAIERVRSGVSPVWKCEHRIRARDGSIRWVFEAAVELRDQNGVSHGSIGLFQDITERKQAEEALQESQQLLRLVMDNIPQAVFWKNKELLYLGANQAFLEDAGLDSPQDLEGKNDFDMPWKEQAELYRADDHLVLEHGEGKLNYEEPQSGPNGKTMWLRTSKVPMRDGNGQVFAVLGTYEDITERKQAEEKIYRLNAELEQRVRERTLQLETTNKELEAFSYSVSHDLRAPLRGIDGWSQALLEDYHDQLDEQGQQYIDRVRSDTQRMGRLIDDMLQLSRLTRAEMVKEQVDLSALAQDIVERLKRDEPQRQVDFNIQTGIIAEGDSHLLEIVLINLLGNAFKFTAKRADALIEFGQTELEDQRVFFVRDNGAGFDMTYAQKLFGAFQRMHKVSEFPGTGIGLATVQRIIHRHGGGVWAEAEVGRGATFYFTLDG